MVAAGGNAIGYLLVVVVRGRTTWRLSPAGVIVGAPHRS